MRSFDGTVGSAGAREGTMLGDGAVIIRGSSDISIERSRDSFWLTLRVHRLL